MHILKDNRVRLLALILITTLLALPILTYPLGRDQGEFATIGRGILQGRVPYAELWNPKPPAVFYVYALAMSILGRTASALRAIDLLIVPLISLMLYGIAKRIANPRVGLWAALIFPVFYFTETFWTLTQNDGIVLVPMVGAVWAIIASQKSPVASRQSKTENSGAKTQYSVLSTQYLGYFVAGALSAYAVWFKYPFALFGVALVVGGILSYQPSAFSLQIKTKGRELRAVLGMLVAFGLGGVLVISGGVLYLASIGAWDELVVSAGVTAQYAGLTANLQDFGDLMRIALGYRLAQWGLLIVLAGVSYLAARWGEKRGTGWRLINLWLLAGLGIMLMQAKGYDYHWLPMLPPLVLLAADCADRILSRLKNVIYLQRAALIGLGGLLLGILFMGIWPNAWPYLSGQENRLDYDKRFVAGEFVADESEAVADYLKARVSQGDSLYIWGFRPEVYYLSGLNPATRFIFQFPLVASWYPKDWQQQNVDTLWAALPPYALVLQVDYMPWVTGTHEDSNALLQQYTELNNWLIYNYERETQIGNFFIWRRKS